MTVKQTAHYCLFLIVFLMLIISINVVKATYANFDFSGVFTGEKQTEKKKEKKVEKK